MIEANIFFLFVREELYLNNCYYRCNVKLFFIISVACIYIFFAKYEQLFIANTSEINYSERGVRF